MTSTQPHSGKVLLLAVFILGVSFFVTPLRDDSSSVGNAIYERTVPRQELYHSPPSALPAALPSCCLLGSKIEVPVPGNSCLVQMYDCSAADSACDGQDVTYTGPAKDPVVVGGKTIQPPADQLTISIPPGQGGHFTKGAQKHICVEPSGNE